MSVEAQKAQSPSAENVSDAVLDHVTELASKIRRLSIAAIYQAKSGHPGGAMSCADLLAALYGAEMNFSPSNIDSPDRDRFVLSKGHGAPALYAAAAGIGLIEAKEAVTLRKLGSRMQGHPHVVDLPWVESSTGSLGQGFSVSIGLAMGLRHQKKDARVYSLLGDGELQEGEVWEGAMSAAHYKLSNLCALIDYNKMQSDDLNANIMGLEPLAEKWSAFGWNAIEIDGHSFPDIFSALKQAREKSDKPTVIIAHTIKGKGVSYMEGVPTWHGSVTMSDADTENALFDLGVEPNDLLDWINGNV